MRKIIIVTLLLAASTFGQTEQYGKHTKEGADFTRKMDLALDLFDHYTSEQKVIILDELNNPSEETAEQARGLFSETEFKNVFYKLGKRDLKAYQAVRDTPVLADKKRTLIGLPNAGKRAIWITHFAYIIATHSLSTDQIEFLMDLSELLTDEPDLTAIKVLGEQTPRVFPRDLGIELFATIGPYSKVGSLCAKTDVMPIEGGDCICAVDHYNWSCNDTCAGRGSCNTVSGCGVLWLFDCTGSCSTSQIQ